MYNIYSNVNGDTDGDFAIQNLNTWQSIIKDPAVGYRANVATKIIGFAKIAAEMSNVLIDQRKE